mmetsp:Transcript_9231/g.16991  ORF Transcript_9231/g.16991 Transcript_9231/m.16991 type:complete len:172 (+) Transcript_9231:59-574(+)
MMMRRRRGEDGLARLPTPCRAARQKDDLCFWSPEDPFAPTRTLLRTPPRSESESTQTSEGLAEVPLVEAAVQADLAGDASGDEMPVTVSRQRVGICGILARWSMRACVASGLALPCFLADAEVPVLPRVDQGELEEALAEIARLREELGHCRAGSEGQQRFWADSARFPWR